MVHVKSKIPLINAAQRAITLDVSVSKPGAYILLVNYVTPLNEDKTHKLDINVTNNVATAGGHVILYSCTYNFLCRQAFINEEGGIGIFYADDDRLTVDIEVCLQLKQFLFWVTRLIDYYFSM